MSVDKVFVEYCNFGMGNNKTNKEMDSSKFKKMLVEAKLFNKGKLNGAETDMIFTRCKNQQKKIPLDTFKAKAIDEIAKAAFGDSSEENKKKVIDTLEKCCPGVNTKVAASGDGVVNRLTDASGYTGAHKERFDKDGKGKGKEGREDVAKNDGYVGNYKNAGSYDKK